MGSSSRRKHKHKRNLTKEQIEAYRQKDKEGHRKRRQGMLNIGESESFGLSSEEEIEYVEGENVEHDIEIGNENVKIDTQNIQAENVGIEDVEHDIQIGNENIEIDNENVQGKNVGFKDVEYGAEIGNEIIQIEGENVGNEDVEHNIELSVNYVSPNYMRNEEPCVEERHIPNSRPSKTPKWLIEIDENIINNFEGKRSTRTIRWWASRLFIQYFSDKTLTEQCQLFVQLLKMQKMRPLLAKLKIHVHKKTEKNNIIVKNLFNALKSIGKTNKKKDKRAARRVITTALVSHQLKKARFMRQTCIDFDINRKTLDRALARRERIDDPLQSDTWAFSGRLPRVDKKLTNNVKQTIQQFWHDNSRVSPNAKDVLKLRIGNQDRTPHPKHFLESSQTMLFKNFIETHPNIEISQRTFEGLKPFYCMPLKIRNTCCCKYHVEFSLYHELLCYIRSILHTNEMLQECGAMHLPKSSRDLLDLFLCSRDDGCFFYRNDCLNAKCSQCGGLSKFVQCFHEGSEHEFGKKLVEKKRYETVKYTLQSGGEGSRCELVSKECSVADFISDFKDNLFYKYARHSHRSQWLDQQFRLCKDSFPIGTIISVVDFAENYTLQPQNEVQSQYYNSIQIAIFVHITFRHAHDSTEEDRKIIREYHFYMSDDRSHSSEYVQHCFENFFEFLQEHDITMGRHLIWSDNCTGQFKNARMFYWLSRMHVERGVPHIWSFFEAGHGKGEHDGAGACVKRALVKEQLKISGEKFSDARSIVDWCSSALSQGGTLDSTVRRFFWLVEEGTVGGRLDCHTIKDSSKMHSFRSSDASTWTIWTRDLACFCQSCIKCEWDQCESSEWVDTWVPQYLTPLSQTISMRNDIMESSVDYDRLSDLLQPGHVFAVVAPQGNEERSDYWLARCVQVKHKLTQPMEDDDGFMFPTGSVVVAGTWLRTYMVRKNGIPAFEDYEKHKTILMYSHLVIATNVMLFRHHARPKTKKLWTLTNADHEAILDTLKQRDDPLGTLE